MAPSLCIGTAQFGLDYGVTNSSGQVSEKNVADILLKAYKSGIGWIDTAQAYGNAEEVLGRNLPDSHSFKVVNKFAPQSKKEFNSTDIENWENLFFKSLSKLRLKKIDSFIVHSPADLSKPGAIYLNEWLFSLRKRGYVRRLGLSIYNACDLDGVDVNLLDLVQLPLSLYDQRLIQDGTINRLVSQGTDIHARSIYLQGRMLTSADKWPIWISEEARNHHRNLESIAFQKNTSLLDLAIGFAQIQTYLEAVVLGVCNPFELRDLQSSWSKPTPWRLNEWKSWSLQDISILDPREWPKSI